MKILHIPSSSQSKAILYYRSTQPCEFLERLNLAETKVRNEFRVMRDPSGRICEADLSDIYWADIIVFCRFYAKGEFFEIVKLAFEKAKELKKKIVWETDDWVLGVPKEFKDVIKKAKETEGFTREMIEGCDAITCPQNYFADFLKKKFKKPAYVLPNSLDLSKWPDVIRKGKEGEIRIGYAASGCHWKEIEFIKKIAKTIKGKYPQVKFILMSPYFKEKGDPIWDEVYGWVEFEDYPKKLSELDLDIGLGYLEDTEFNRMKSNIKFLDYTASGACSVLSDLPPYDDVPKDAAIKIKNKEKDWIIAIESLIKDKIGRDILWTGANWFLKNNFNIEKNAYSWADVYIKIFES